MSVVTATVLSEGKAMDPTYSLVSIDVRAEVNRIPSAELRLIDGDAAARKFPVSDAPFFEPGKNIEIKLRYEGKEDVSIFKGLVVRQAVESGPEGAILIVGLKDKAIKLTGARKSAVYPDKTDDAIIKDLITQAGVEAGTIAATKPSHKGMVQFDATPWDFILLRAEALGMLVTVDAGKVSVGPMASPGGKGKHAFEWGMQEIYEMEIEADATNPYKAVEGAAWDLKQKAASNPKVKGQSAAAAPGNLDPQKLAGAMGRESLTLTHLVPAVPGEVEAWTGARLSRSVLSLLRGRLAVPGDGKIKLLDSLELKGIGNRFNGKTYITGLRHKYDASGWRTDISFGLSPELACQASDIADAPAKGLLPPARGLQIGVVAAFAADPDKELRVKVILPGVDNKPASAVWARLASPDAGKDRGWFFRPEVEDEVVVGFLNDDPRHPIILGALFGSKNTAPKPLGQPDAKNEKKGIVTKKGTTIGFVDADKPSVYIETAGKNRLAIDDNAGGITLKDQNGNSITLSSSGITIDAGGNNVTIKGAKVDVK